jgi:hypothetical protein
VDKSAWDIQNVKIGYTGLAGKVHVLQEEEKVRKYPAARPQKKKRKKEKKKKKKEKAPLSKFLRVSRSVELDLCTT